MAASKGSRKVRISGPAGDTRRPSHVAKTQRIKVYGPNAIRAEALRAEERRAVLEAGLDSESVRILAEMRGEVPIAQNDGEPSENMIVDDDHAAADTGQWEDVAQEHNGDTAFVHALRDIVGSQWKTRWYKDTRTWRQRVQKMDDNWRPLIPDLVDAYVAWRHPVDPQPAPDIHADGTYNFDISIFDIYTLANSTTIARRADEKSTAVALVRNGFLGTTPLSPSLAISLKTLELLRCIRLYKPSFSIEAFAKLLCYFYLVPYRRHLRGALADAYEIYLMIHRALKQRILVVLGRDTQDWRALNACPACSYELEGEAPLRWRRMLCMDGNNSLKRLASVGSRARGDIRTFDSGDYFLPDDFVNEYADEIKAPPRPSGEDGETPEADHDSEGDPTDGIADDPGAVSCTRNWKAAAAEDKKRMWGVFEETGIFAMACRHGFVIWLADMKRSGELAKYPLAMVSKALQVFGDNILLGYDIGCTFEGTIRRSSLGSEWQSRMNRCCVNAFHGYTHNYQCQTQNHPNVIQGMGLEDLETLERIFSSSNNLASVTRYASPYRRRLLIDEYFQQWDEEKYSALSTMIYQNYLQALGIIKTESVALVDAMRSLDISKDDLDAWYHEEREYFRTLGQESDADLHAVAYVESLQDLRHLRAQLDIVSGRFLGTAPASLQFLEPSSTSVDYYAEISRTRKLETERRYLAERYEDALRDVVALEVRLNITNRWEPTDTEYIAAAKYLATRKYHLALNNLQRLVIQRLFELHKLNLSQTAYRIRTHVAKSLQARCKAIRSAVQVYNTAANALDPPRPTLDWSKVSHYSFLDEFELLRDTANDVREKPWAKPAVRETMKQARRVERAREELIRCNIEARRLCTSIYDEGLLFDSVLERLQQASSPLYGPTKEYCQRRRNINALHVARLQQLDRLDDFSGDLSPGQRKGAPLRPSLSLPSIGSDQPLVSVQELAEDEELAAQDDEFEGDIGGLVEYVSNLSLQ